jgi:pyruvate/2-oxoacid:ferredoxin oxidoreductase alpha subunit
MKPQHPSPTASPKSFRFIPITPSSTMAEFADQWAADGQRNIWGSVPGRR